MANKQSLVHLGSSLRDQLESVGASMTPPMRWQDLARQVIKNFVHAQTLAGVLQTAQTEIVLNGEPIAKTLQNA